MSNEYNNIYNTLKGKNESEILNHSVSIYFYGFKTCQLNLFFFFIKYIVSIKSFLCQCSDHSIVCDSISTESVTAAVSLNINITLLECVMLKSYFA